MGCLHILGRFGEPLLVNQVLLVNLINRLIDRGLQTVSTLWQGHRDPVTGYLHVGIESVEVGVILSERLCGGGVHQDPVQLVGL